jgi:hypothetical protein
MKLITIVFFVLFITSKCFAQKSAPDYVSGDGKQNLSGKWEVSCPMEYENQATIRFCELCQFKIDPKDNSNATVSDLDLIFEQDSIVLIKENVSQKVPYTMNKDTHAFSFILNKKEFRFRVFYGDSRVILEDDEGAVLELKREVKKGK